MLRSTGFVEAWNSDQLLVLIKNVYMQFNEQMWIGKHIERPLLLKAIN